MKNPEIIIDTEFGKFRIIGWSGKYIHVTSSIDTLVKYVNVNGVHMDVAMNFTVDQHGRVELPPDSFNARKVFYSDWRHADASPKACQKLKTIVPPLVEQALRANPAFLLEAEIEGAQNDLNRQVEDIKTAEKELRAMRAKKRAHQRRIDKASSQLEKITR